jgi:hypothetical protein
VTYGMNRVSAVWYQISAVWYQTGSQNQTRDQPSV